MRAPGVISTTGATGLRRSRIRRSSRMACSESVILDRLLASRSSLAMASSRISPIARARVALFVVACALASLFAPQLARADLPPLDACNAPGNRCFNAGDFGSGPGTCVITTCSRFLPGSGGGKTVTYECKRCVADGTSAPTPTAASSPSSPSSPAASASSAPPTQSSRFGCDVGPIGLRDSWPAVAVAAAALLARGRRRRA